MVTDTKPVTVSVYLKKHHLVSSIHAVPLSNRRENSWGTNRLSRVFVSDEDVGWFLITRGARRVMDTASGFYSDPLAVAVWGGESRPAGSPVLHTVACTSVPQILTQGLRFAPHAHSLTLGKENKTTRNVKRTSLSNKLKGQHCS
jgi:hypothetical protein